MNHQPSYELFEELGRGVNTVVYRAYDLSLGREVAIKELDETARRDPRHRERFLREAQFLAQFEHDNVLRVYSVDTERGWIVMELMKGTLATLIANGPSDPDLVRSILKQTLDALAFLHEKNKVHGTVRPTNLLINDAGRVKLSEFEQTDVGGELRAPQGSKKYLAPELIRPEFGGFSPSLDLYCLGFTALELLKGSQFESLFPGTGKGAIDADIAWLRWHSSSEELATTRKLVKGIPDDLAHVLDHMLKKRVADRPQSAQEVLKELADRPLVAVPMASVTDDDAATSGPRALSPAIVRTLAAPQTVLPSGTNPSVNTSVTATRQQSQPAQRTTRQAKAAGPSGKPSAPRFSKDWFNEQLGRPYVLYPLCAAILVGALLFSIRLNSGGSEAAKFVAVAFDIQPDRTGVEVVSNKGAVVFLEDGKYPFPPGRHAVTFRKNGFQPLTKEFDVSAEKNHFPVKLVPIIKIDDVVINVSPADSRLNVAGEAKTTTSGIYTHKLQQGEPLSIEASREGYASVSRTISSEELARLGYKVTMELEREKPRLPKSLVAKPSAELDRDLQLPIRVLAAGFSSSEPMELVLVKPGTYSFGNPSNDRPAGELSNRTVRIEQPFYIAVHETTNSQYQQFFESAGQSQSGTRWQRAAAKWAAALKLDPEKNNLPVTNVSTDEAQSFCKWLGGRLPTEIEWESAVRGPQDRGFPQPWGTAEPNRERCRIFDANPEHELGPVPVDTLAAGASPLGLMHAVGNATEWCHDSEEAGKFVLRGCGFTTANINDVHVTWRGRGDTRGDEETGFRVVIPIAEQSGSTPVTTAQSPSTTTAKITGPYAFVNLVPWQNLSRALTP
jgi:serine/threonine protein kinase/formylglycine-generating enzyme required for sulfatase activity